jgi:hypothetical protein
MDDLIDESSVSAVTSRAANISSYCNYSLTFVFSSLVIMSKSIIDFFNKKLSI